MKNTKNNSVAKGFYWSLSEKILTEVFRIIISILLARLLLPKEFGTVALIEVFISFFSLFIMFGLGNALVQKKSPSEEEYSTIFYINMILGIVLYILLFFISPLIADFFDNNDLCILLRVLGLKLPIGSIFSIQEARIHKELDFKKLFFSSLAGTIIGGAIGLTMALNGFGVWALIAYPLIDQIIDSLILFIATKWFPKPVLSFKKCTPLYRYGIKIFASEFIGRVCDQFRMLAIGKVYKEEELAYNSKGQKLPQALVDVVDTTTIRVMFPTLSKNQDNKSEMVSLSKKYIQMCSFFLSPLMFGLIATANNFIPFLYGNNWNECVPYVQLYCLAFILNPIQLINIKMVQASGRSDITLATQIIKVCLSVLIIVITLVFFTNPLSIVISYVIYMVLTLFINSFPCKKMFGYGLTSQLLDALPSFLISFLMGIVVYYIGTFNAPVVVLLVAQVIAGISFYFFVSWILRIESFEMFIKIIKKIGGKKNVNS